MKPISAAFCTAFVSMALLVGCGSGSSGSDSLSLPDLPVFDSTAMKSVKTGRIQACPTKTLEQMANDFFMAPSWYEFTSTTGKTVIELSGTLSYQGSPAIATIQFVVDSLGGFEASYLELDGQAQNILVLSGLLQKMCAA